MEKQLDLSSIKSAHFIGIGGIGISAIAKMFILRKFKVSGSDSSSGEAVRILRNLGAQIEIGHSERNIPPDTDIVIYTIAIPKDNPELEFAQKKWIKTYTYPQILGHLSKSHFTIAISGTHGKTTTTGMIAHTLLKLGADPTVIIGSYIKTDAGKTNFLAGKSKLLVVEACEYKRSFLNLFPDLVIITNIEEDHLDYYKGIDDILDAFTQFACQIKRGGTLIVDLQDKNVLNVANAVKKARPDVAIIDYGVEPQSGIKINLPGMHNQKNAAAALCAIEVLNFDRDQALIYLGDFRGTWRRLEYKGKTAKGALVYDDYGHHPTEIRSTINGLRELYKENKIVLAFQPHQYSRTKLFIDDFVRSFAGVDNLYVLPIYAAREKIDPEIDNKILANKIAETSTVSRVEAVETFDQVIGLFNSEESGSICITVGAGDINMIADRLVASK